MPLFSSSSASSGGATSLFSSSHHLSSSLPSVNHLPHHSRVQPSNAIPEASSKQSASQSHSAPIKQGPLGRVWSKISSMSTVASSRMDSLMSGSSRSSTMDDCSAVSRSTSSSSSQGGNNVLDQSTVSSSHSHHSFSPAVTTSSTFKESNFLSTSSSQPQTHQSTNSVDGNLHGTSASLLAGSGGDLCDDVGDVDGSRGRAGWVSSLVETRMLATSPSCQLQEQSSTPNSESLNHRQKAGKSPIGGDFDKDAAYIRSTTRNGLTTDCHGGTYGGVSCNGSNGSLGSLCSRSLDEFSSSESENKNNSNFYSPPGRERIPSKWSGGSNTSNSSLNFDTGGGASHLSGGISFNDTHTLNSSSGSISPSSSSQFGYSPPFSSSSLSTSTPNSRSTSSSLACWTSQGSQIFGSCNKSDVVNGSHSGRHNVGSSGVGGYGRDNEGHADVSDMSVRPSLNDECLPSPPSSLPSSRRSPKSHHRPHAIRGGVASSSVLKGYASRNEDTHCEDSHSHWSRYHPNYNSKKYADDNHQDHHSHHHYSHNRHYRQNHPNMNGASLDSSSSKCNRSYGVGNSSSTINFGGNGNISQKSVPSSTNQCTTTDGSNFRSSCSSVPSASAQHNHHGVVHSDRYSNHSTQQCVGDRNNVFTGDGGIFSGCISQTNGKSSSRNYDCHYSSRQYHSHHSDDYYRHKTASASATPSSHHNVSETNGTNDSIASGKSSGSTSAISSPTTTTAHNSNVGIHSHNSNHYNIAENQYQYYHANINIVKTELQSRQLALDDFLIHATVGTGSFGRVCVVDVKGSPAYYPPFALKILSKAKVVQMKQMEHVKDEKKILSAVSHPFIVHLLRSFQDEKRLFMLMEYVNGGELFRHLRAKRCLSSDETRFYAAEITLAFQYLHSKRIVYRDLKPENLLIDFTGHIKITDFGFAKMVEDRTFTLCGTHEYLAPETIMRRGHSTPVDWWALGILLFEMLAGYPPFFDQCPIGIYRKILSVKFDFPRWIDSSSRSIIKRLLTADPSKRYGCLKDGAEDVKNHKFFKGVDWQVCFRRGLQPPYIPETTGPRDTSRFESYPESTENGGGKNCPMISLNEQLTYFSSF